MASRPASTIVIGFVRRKERERAIVCVVEVCRVGVLLYISGLGRKGFVRDGDDALDGDFGRGQSVQSNRLRYPDIYLILRNMFHTVREREAAGGNR